MLRFILTGIDGMTPIKRGEYHINLIKEYPSNLKIQLLKWQVITFFCCLRDEQ